MKLSKKMSLLLLALVGCFCACPSIAMDVSGENFNGAVQRAAGFTLLVVVASCSIEGKVIFSCSDLVADLILPVIKSIQFNRLSDVSDTKLLAIGKEALDTVKPGKAESLQIKLDEDFSRGWPNEYVTSTLFYVIPVIVLNPEALKSRTVVSSLLHEAGHIADNQIDITQIIPMGLLWIVEPAAKKVTECVCEPLLDEAISITKKMVKSVAPDKKAGKRFKQTISTWSPFVKACIERVCRTGMVFVAAMGFEALNAYLCRKKECFADDFACKHTKDPKELSWKAKGYSWLAEYDDKMKQENPVMTYLDSWFERHPSNQSRGEKFTFHAERKMNSKSIKSIINTGVDLLKKYLKWPNGGLKIAFGKSK